MDEDIREVVEQYISRFGRGAILLKLNNGASETNVLTIIANAGVHPYHPLHERGEIFIASRGNLDFSSKASATAEIRAVLTRVASKLKEKRWSKVFLVPFGPAPLSLQIKSLVYKILDLETIDVLHAGSGVHFDIELDPRKIAIDAQAEQ